MVEDRGEGATEAVGGRVEVAGRLGGHAGPARDRRHRAPRASSSGRRVEVAAPTGLAAGDLSGAPLHMRG